MRVTTRRAIAATFACAFIFSGQSIAHADDGEDLTTTNTDVRIKAWRSGHRDPATPHQNRGTSQPKSKSASQDQYAKQLKAFRAKVDRTIAHNEAVSAARAKCADSADTCQAPDYQIVPGGPGFGAHAGPAQAAEPALSPQQAAYYAAARIKLTPPKPMVGPPPSINQWKMAAVGYPLWLWADGNLDPAPVTDTVADISVGLDARLVKIVYDMGDGHKLTCTNVSRQWTRDVAPATPSPACGYAYQKPSLPKGKYTITANAVWAVDWNVNGTTGTIPFYQSATTQLPVGELQVLVH